MENGWIKLASPWIDDVELGEAAGVLSSGRLVKGRKGAGFEEAVGRIVGVRHAVAVSSGTMSLFAVLHALGVGRGDEVVVPALTFPAAAECAMMLGARPVFVDVSRSTFNVDPDLVRRAITDRTRAVIAVDQFGSPADYEALERVVGRGGLELVEDAACALGSTFRGRPCGSFGRAAVLSFHPRKVITTGEGGMVLTDDDGLAAKVRMLRNHGIDRAGAFVGAGLNLRMGEVEAAVGLGQLRKLEEIVRRRKRLASAYRRRLEGVLDLQHAPEGGESNYQTFAAVLPEGGRSERDALVAEAASRKVELQVASYSLPSLPAYAGLSEKGSCPESERIHERGIALPLHPLMKEEDVDHACTVLVESMEKLNMSRMTPAK